jgi:peptide/nickel transport system substrate-binding protein
VIENDIDLFAFWHSSKRLQGLNLSSYVNTKIDKIIESLKNETDKEKKKELYQNFVLEMKKDIPATFIYSPDFIYAVDKKLNTENLNYLKKPSDRFDMVHTWYTEKEAIWAFMDRVTIFKKIQKLIQ